MSYNFSLSCRLSRHLAVGAPVAAAARFTGAAVASRGGGGPAPRPRWTVTMESCDIWIHLVNCYVKIWFLQVVTRCCLMLFACFLKNIESTCSVATLVRNIDGVSFNLQLQTPKWNRNYASINVFHLQTQGNIQKNTKMNKNDNDL